MTLNVVAKLSLQGSAGARAAHDKTFAVKIETIDQAVQDYYAEHQPIALAMPEYTEWFLAEFYA